MIDEGAEQHDEDLAERDRVGEKAPAADAMFGAASGVVEAVLVEHKDCAHVPPNVAARQMAVYRRLTGYAPAADAAFGSPADPYSVDPAKMTLQQRMRWIVGLPLDG